MRGRTGDGGAGGPVVAGDPRGGWPPADTGIVLPEYSTPRYRDLLPPRLGGRRQVGLVSPEVDRHNDQSSLSRAGKDCRPMDSSLTTATDGTRRELEPSSNVAIELIGVRLENRVTERPIAQMTGTD